MSTRCFLVYGTNRVTQNDMTLSKELQRRGYEVCVAVRDGRVSKMSLAARLRMRVEGLFFPSPKLIDVHSLPADRVDHCRCGDELAELIRSRPSSLVFDFCGQFVSTTDADSEVYRIALDGRIETLRMLSAYTGNRNSYDLAVMSYKRGERDARVVQHSTIVSEHSWVSADQLAASNRAVVLLLRAINQPTNPGDLVDALDRGEPHPFETLRATASTIARAVVRRLVRRWWRTDSWFLAYRVGAEARSSHFEDAKHFFGGRERFYADPCVVRRGPDYFVFYEDYRYALRRGVISVSTLQPNGSLSAPQTVLERPYHLSYPFVFEFSGDWWMVPETAANHTVELYRAVDFPTRWELHATLLSDVNAVDATLHHDGERWWMFVSIGEQRSSTSDELSIFMADSLAGPWRPHPRNPVKRGAQSSRPAGRLFREAGALLRPAQDCSKVYGGGIRFCRVDVLTESDFEEEEIDFLPPSAILGAEALHTWSAAGDLQIIDARLPSTPTHPRRFQRRLKALRGQRRTR